MYLLDFGATRDYPKRFTDDYVRVRSLLVGDVIVVVLQDVVVMSHDVIVVVIGCYCG